MLDSITIKNFKAIGENGLTLSGLTNVNYLVGKNGCGKSSILELLNFANLNNNGTHIIHSLTPFPPLKAKDVFEGILEFFMCHKLLVLDFGL
jgi:AAA15 family ATPase/GTPase